MTCGLVPFKGGGLIQVKMIRKDKHRTTTAWPWPLNIEVKNTAFV